ncbi:hypothetical protein OO010_02090 [Flavobacteriaceae bacterium KMM 6898]|nr:hypothetical protein [Flavobacteriaceae bacterium KMM 6898]
MQPTAIKIKIFNILSIICACLLFFAGLDLPEVFYTYLRVLVTCVALLTMVNNIGKNRFFAIAFGIVAFIFNPIFPLDLYAKTVWVLLDIITALLFLLEAYDIPGVKSAALKRRTRRRLFRYKL